MATRHQSLPPLHRGKRPGGRKATPTIPEWLDVIHFGQLTPARDDFKSMASEDKSAVPSCYESCDSTSLSSSDNTSENGGKYGPLKDGYPGRYSFRCSEGGEDKCKITRLCITRHGSFGSTGFEPGAADATYDDLPEMYAPPHSRSSSSSETQTRSHIGRETLYASLPKDFLRVPRSRKGRFLLTRGKNGDRKAAEVAEVRRVPSDSADSGIYTTFGKEVRSYAIPECGTVTTQEEEQQQVKDDCIPCVVEVGDTSQKTEEKAAEPPRLAPIGLEAEQRRRQRHTEMASILVFVPVVIAWILIVPMVLFAYSIENPYSRQFEVALWIAIPASTSVLVLSCLISNVYWYYDEEQGRWQYRLHCGSGPRGFYWGDALTNSAKASNVQHV